MTNGRRVVKTDNAPAPVGPYSQAVISEKAGLVFLAGQIPMDPRTGEFIQTGIEDETRKIFENIHAVLVAAGSSLQQVIKTTVFLASMDDFQSMNRIYGEFFPENPPARSCVEVSRLPKGVGVEIEVIAQV